MVMHPTPRQRWALCGMLFLATTLNYLDRQTMAILAPTMQRDLSLDNEALGWLFSVFYYSYTFAQFGIGGLLDRWHLRWAYGAGVLIWSLVAALTGLAGSFVMLVVFRLLLGLTESVNWPAAIRIVARALPAEERALGNGFFTSGTSIGALIAPGIILGIAEWLGWRWAFVLTGAAGAAWFMGWLLFTRGTTFESVWTRDAPPSSASAGIREILRTLQFWRVFAVTVLVNPCLYFSVNWLPTYFSQQRGLSSAKELGLILTLVYLGLDIGNLACGTAILALTKRGWQLERARAMMMAVATLLLGTCGLTPLFQQLNAAIAVLVMANIGAGLWIAMYLTLAQEVSRTRVATAAGLLGGSGSLAGAVLMWLVGLVTKQTGSFSGPMIGVSVAALLAFFAGLAALRGKADQASFGVAQ